MKKVIGLILVFAGLGFGLWAGLWWAFIGGIVDVVQAVRATELSMFAVGTGVLKIMFAGVIGWGAAFVAIIPGVAILQK